MIHSFHNARSKGKNCLDMLNVRQSRPLRRQPYVGCLQ